VLPRFLPHDWKGCFALLVIVVRCCLRLLDNIAAALIGGCDGPHAVPCEVHIGYLAAIVAASMPGARQRGGRHHTTMSGSGVSIRSTCWRRTWARRSRCRLRHSPRRFRSSAIPRSAHEHQQIHIDWARLGDRVLHPGLWPSVTNVVMKREVPGGLDHFPLHRRIRGDRPFAQRALRRPDWEVLPETSRKYFSPVAGLCRRR